MKLAECSPSVHLRVMSNMRGDKHGGDISARKMRLACPSLSDHVRLRLEGRNRRADHPAKEYGMAFPLCSVH